MGQILCQKKSASLEVKIFTDSRPLLDSISSTHQIDEKLLRMDIQDFKEKLYKKSVECFCWLDTSSMIADSLTKESKYSEDLNHAVMENRFMLSLFEFNQVSFSDGEIKMTNMINKKQLEKYQKLTPSATGVRGGSKS